MSKQAYSPAEAKVVGESRETWCAVEMKKEQTFCRTERKHDDKILSSCVFDVQRPQYEPRCTFAVNAPTHRERRHYDQQSQIR